ncbi:MAG TPA: hypothetical protein VJJ23_01155 [Candidatus Nanoarchaeia archaeon]|nr:hypothetical protein [Candidatus Nanoarchaeia archaeon]
MTETTYKVVDYPILPKYFLGDKSARSLEKLVKIASESEVNLLEEKINQRISNKERNMPGWVPASIGVIALIGVADLTIGYHLNSPGIKLIGLAASAGALVISPLFGLVYYHQTIDTNKAKKYIDRKKGKIA